MIPQSLPGKLFGIRRSMAIPITGTGKWMCITRSHICIHSSESGDPFTAWDNATREGCLSTSDIYFTGLGFGTQLHEVPSPQTHILALPAMSCSGA